MQKGLLRDFFGFKFDPATSGGLDMLNSNFLDFYTSSTFFGNAIGSPKNAQNFDFFMYTKTGSDLTTFGKIQKIQSGSPVLIGKKNSLGYFSCTHRYQAIWGIK